MVIGMFYKDDCYILPGGAALTGVTEETGFGAFVASGNRELDMKKIFLALSLMCGFAAERVNAEIYEYPRAAPLPQDDTANLLRDTDLLTGFDINMSSERFAKAWLSKTNERERIKAEMYFLGVMDATEGKAWCSYQRLLPSSAHEQLYSRFANLTSQERKTRASTLIVESLSDVLPCKKEMKK